MAVDIGPRIGIDGEKQFRDELKNINQSLKTLDSEMKVVKSSFDGQKKSAEQLKKENEVLERSVLTLKEKLRQQEDALEKCARKYGEADTKTMKWQQAVNETKTALNNAENAIKNNTRAMDDYNDELDQAQTHTSTFGETFKGTFAGMAVSKGLALVVEGAKKLAQGTKDAVFSGAEYADEILTLSQVTGLGTQELQEFKYMSELVDVDMDTLTGSLSKLTRNMSSAQKGTGNAATAFKKLGISVTDNNGALRNNKDVFLEIIEALGQMENATERDAAAMDIFGKSAQDLNPLILAGKDQLGEYIGEAHDFGVVLSKADLGKLGDVDDDLYRIKTQLEGIKLEFLVENMDEIQEIMETLPTLIQDVSDTLGPLLELLAPVSTLVSKISNAVRDFNTERFTNMLYGYSYENGSASGRKTLPTSQPGTFKKGAAINIYPQSMTRGQTDYVISAANRSLGGKL